MLPAMNGVPWWFGDGIAALGAAPLQSVDPDADSVNVTLPAPVAV